MKALYPGLLVKVVAVDSMLPADWLGREGRIVEINSDGDDDEPTLYGLDVCPLFYDYEYVYGLEAYQLEPILPDGLEEEIAEETEEELVYV